MIPRLEIPLIPQVMNVDGFDRETSDRITKAITQWNGQLKMLLSAVLDTHQTNTDDIRALKEKFASMRVSTKRDERGFHMVFENVPSGVAYDGIEITKSQVEFVSEIIRDIVFCPEIVADASSEEITESLRVMVERAGLLNENEEETIRSFVWGGHTISPEEYAFAKRIGYWDGLKGIELVTGGGGGVMKAPFSGARNGYMKQRLDRHFIGFSEKGILAGEAPNNLLTTLCVFPDIEKRMESFIRLSHRGRVHPGGTGTMEEIMTFLGMKIHPNNEGLVYPFDLVDRPEGSYMTRLQEFFRTCFGHALDDFLNFRVESPQNYHRYVSESNRDLSPGRRWNSELHVPPEIQQPFEVTFASMEALDLTREQDPFQLVVNLRRFFSGMVYLVVKNPAMVQSWGDDRPKIKGDKVIIQEVHELVRWFNDHKRLKMHLKLDEMPYRVE